MSGRDVFILGAVRSPVARGYPNGAYYGALQPVELLAKTLEALMSRTGAPKEQVEDVITGCVSPVGDQGGNIGRLGALAAGFPNSVPGVQLNRMCGSGQQAIHFAAQAIAAGDMELAIGCGVEMMSTVKMGSDFMPSNPAKLQAALPFKIFHQGFSAELIAAKYDISRDSMDKFAAQSHANCDAATKRGDFDSEVFPITVPEKSKTGQLVDGSFRVISTDEGIRHPTNFEKLKKLKTPFKKGGVVTAAHASQVSDGAGAVLLASGAKARDLGIRPLARIVSRAVVGSDPELMLTGPIAATQLALKKAGLQISDIDRFEINEAFASVVLAWKKALNPDMSKVNVNGGAIAHGHPLGATGAILMTKLVHELKRSNTRYGLLTMCIGWGMATGTVIENYDFVANKAKM
eukprot:TRINITY_DN7828_c0_g1_i1.p1 TRINITY_DN7828_c0_g1~~TRINITY_DN7828_c0_g1_i1.p1  ORF type:complete len:405 (+),score=82.30 TRINITY_DN7828_c0_g1_i1:3-1217(+)